MTVYEHRQFGYVTVAMIGIAALITIFITATGWTGLPDAGRIIVSVVVVALALIIFTFSSLEVTVTDEHIKLRFGPGLIRKTFALSDVRGAAQVRNRWWYGWGIRLTPHGWLFNVSGLDAVELDLMSGRKFRIGTDEPERLVRAIVGQLAKVSK